MQMKLFKASVLFSSLLFSIQASFSQEIIHLNQNNAVTFEEAFSNMAGTKLSTFGMDILQTFITSKQSQILLKNGDNPEIQITGAPLGSSQYRLGPGDSVTFFIWGESIDATLIQNPNFPITVNLVVSTDGSILYPGVGRFDVRGRTLSEVKEIVRSEMSKKYRKFDLGISLLYPRNQQIWITGYVKMPGQREIPPNSSLLEALAAAGGPSDSGSLRNITVYRSTTDETFNVDLYPLLLGEMDQPLSLSDGDRIMVGPKGVVVALSGSVLRPAIYEFLTPPSLAEALRVAGGVTPFATNFIKVIQPSGQGFINLTKEATENQKLISGSLTIVPARETNLFIGDKLGDYISEFPVLIGGAVAKSGLIGVKARTRLSEALKAAGGYGPDAFPEGLVLLRQSVRQAQLQQTTRLLQDLNQQKKSVEGLIDAARAANPATPPQDLIKSLESLEKNIKDLEFIQNDKGLGRIALQIPPTVEALEADLLQNIELEPGDTVMVPKRPTHVLVLGSTFQQNSFPFVPGKRVRDYVTMAGGATSFGDVSETYLIKASGQVRSPRSGQGFLWFRPDPLDEVISPGDTIVVPSKMVTAGVDWLELTNRALGIVSSTLSIGLNSIQLVKLLE